VVGHLTAALATGTPLLLAAPTPVQAAVPIDVPPALRDLEVARGCAADYDTWLTEETA
jgi:hypothetical protein